MDYATRSQVEGHARRPTAESTSRGAPAHTDRRTEAVAQRALIESMRSGPAAVAQLRDLQGLFGTAAQLEAAPEEEEQLQMKRTTAQLQGPEDEELQMKRPASRNDTGMPDGLKSGIESLSGFSMDDVKVHYNSPQPAQLNALAYAQGTEIHLAPGQEQHLPHEAWHVVQQAEGRVQPTTQMKDNVPINDDVGLEHEADVMGARALANPRTA